MYDSVDKLVYHRHADDLLFAVRTDRQFGSQAVWRPDADDAAGSDAAGSGAGATGFGAAASASGAVASPAGAVAT